MITKIPLLTTTIFPHNNDFQQVLNVKVAVPGLTYKVAKAAPTNPMRSAVPTILIPASTLAAPPVLCVPVAMDPVPDVVLVMLAISESVMFISFLDVAEGVKSVFAAYPAGELDGGASGPVPVDMFDAGPEAGVGS